MIKKNEILVIIEAMKMEVINIKINYYYSTK